MKKLLLGLLMMVAVLPIKAGETDFMKRCTVSVTSYSGQDLTDFPVLVRISPTTISGFSYADAASDGSDVRAFDSAGNLLPVEVDTWNTEGESLVWVKVSSFNASSTFNLCWGAKGTPPANNPGDVWTAYAGVWHMNEASGAVADSTGHGLAAAPKQNTDVSIAVTDVGAPTGTGRQTATAAKKSYLSIPSYDSLALGAQFTIMGWAKMTSAGGYMRFFSRKSEYRTNNGWETEFDNGSSTRLSIRGASSSSFVATLPTLMNAWVHVALAYNDSTATVYANGASVGSGSLTTPTDNNLPLSLGCDSDGDESYFRGYMDEVRLYKGVIDAERLSAEYTSVMDASFLSYTAAEDTLPFALTKPTVSFDNTLNTFTVSFSVTKGPCDVSVRTVDGDGAVKTVLVKEGATVGDYSAEVTDLPTGGTIKFGVRATDGTVTSDWVCDVTYLNPTAFRKYSVVSVPGYEAEETLTDFPVLLQVGANAPVGFDWAAAGEGGARLRFADLSGRPIPHEIETWPADTTAEGASARIWVRVSALSTGATFRMYWGGTATLGAVDSTETWSAYAGVWHMNEADGAVADSTGHGLTATPKGDSDISVAVTDVDAPTGIGRQTATAAKKSYLSVPTYDSLALGGKFTIMGWAKMTSASGCTRLFSRKNGYKDSNGWETEFGDGSKTAFSARGASESSYSATLPSLMDAWVHVAIAYDNSTAKTYANGALAGGGSITAATDNNLPLSFGCDSNGDEAYFRGYMDEVRLKATCASAAWVKAEYDSIVSANFTVAAKAVDIQPADVCKVTSATPVWTAENGFGIGFTIGKGVGDISTVVTAMDGSAVTNLYQASLGVGDYVAPLTGLTEGAVYNVGIFAQTGEATAYTDADTIYVGNVSIGAGDNADLKNDQFGTFTIALPEGVTLDVPLTIAYSVGGTAVAGADYTALSGTVVIPAGENAVVVSVRPLVNGATTTDTTLTLTLTPGAFSTTASTRSAEITVVPCPHRWGLKDGKVVEHTLIGTPWRFKADVDEDGVILGKVDQKGTSTAIDFNDADDDCVITRLRDTFYQYKKINLDSVTLPKTLKTILNTYALQDCTTTIYLPADNALEVIPKGAFRNSGLQGVVVLSNAVEVGKEAFYDCKSVTGVILGEGVRNVTQDSFKNVAALERLEMCGNVTNIELWAVHGCDKLAEWVYSSYPTFDPKWIGDPSQRQGFNVRAFVPLTVYGWKAIVEDSSVFIPWANCDAASKSAYFETFGSGAEEPMGYTTKPMKMWLMKKPVPAQTRPRLLVTGLPVEYSPALVTPTYGDYREIPASELPMTLTASYSYDGDILHAVTGYTLERYDFENECWVDAVTVAERSFTYDPEGAPYNRLTWNWEEAGYTLKVMGLKEGTSVTTNAVDLLEGYWRKGSTASFTAVGDNFKRWYGDVDAAQQSARTILVTVDAPKRLTPYFESAWTYDADAKTLTDGYWTFNATASDKELTITGVKTAHVTGILIDFTKPIADGYVITTIGTSVFESKNASYADEILLPKTLRNVKSKAFYLCLPPIILPTDNQITNLGANAFCLASGYSGGLTGDIVLEKIEVIDNQGLYYADKVTSLVLGKNLREYPKNMQNDCVGFCRAMTNLVLKGTYMDLGQYAFCENSALTDWHWATYPNSIKHATRWYYGTKTGTGVRFFIPHNCAGWEEKIAADTFTPWASCTPAQQQAYYTAFGAQAVKPIGYTTQPMATWLVYESTPGFVIIIK